VQSGQVRVKYKDGSYGPLREIRVGGGYWSQNRNTVIHFRSGAESVDVKHRSGKKYSLPVPAPQTLSK